MCPDNSVHHGCGGQGEAFWAQLISTLPPHGHRKSMLFSQNISEGGGGLAEKAVHTRAKITFLTHNQFPQLQQHVIRPRWSRRRKSISWRRWPITQSLAPMRCPITQNLETHNVKCQALEGYINLRPRKKMDLVCWGGITHFYTLFLRE